MIARILFLLLGLIVLPDAYLYYACAWLRGGSRKWRRLALFLQAAALVACTCALSGARGFAPESVGWLNAYLLLLGVWVVPKALFAVCHLLGLGHCRFHKTRRNLGAPVGLALALAVAGLTLYGSTVGFNRVVVRHETCWSRDLPEAFDGYRIAHLSDLHVGTFSGGRSDILRREADSVNAQGVDLIAFTGDLQNARPSELPPVEPLLRRMRAKDGVVSVLGNHDYADYSGEPQSRRPALEEELRGFERSLGWRLLLNADTVLRRGGDSIVVAGMENEGRPPFPQRGDVKAAEASAHDGSFVIMLEHDPTAWRRVILPQSRAQLTLSGHTHAMQFELMGWSPASLVYSEWGGMYREGGRTLSVSKGMGGLIPFRIGASNEIVVITLRRGSPQRQQPHS